MRLRYFVDIGQAAGLNAELAVDDSALFGLPSPPNPSTLPNTTNSPLGGYPLLSPISSSANSYWTNSPVFRAVMGLGNLTLVGMVANGPSSSNVWITNVLATVAGTGTNATVTLRFTLAGGLSGVLYDVFANAVAGPTNAPAYAWAWMGQGQSWCSYTLPNLPLPSAYLILGQPTDSDADGLTDAYEKLVSHTDPSNPDSNGTGLLDGWYLAYNLPQSIDPYSQCINGDGWTILQACQNGWNPSVGFHTPPPPENVVASLDSTGTNVIVTWASGGGPVTQYAIQQGTPGAGYVRARVASNIFTFTGNMSILDTYFVTAYFTNGSSADSQPVPVNGAGPSPPAGIARGPSGNPYLVVGSEPPAVSLIRLGWNTGNGPQSIDQPATSLTNGVTPLPLAQMSGYVPGSPLSVECFAVNGSLIPTLPYSATYVAQEALDNPTDPAGSKPAFRFENAAAHLKANLAFLLRAAGVIYPFAYAADPAAGGQVSPLDSYLATPDDDFARPPSPGSYEYSGFRQYSPTLGYSFMSEVRPVQENFLFNNFLYDPSLAPAGTTNTVEAEVPYAIIRK
jgi:hypothetical protein